MRAVIYARVSTEEQAEEGHSIDAQLRIVREFCAHRGWTVVGEYIDPGRSGRTLKRPKMQALIADAQLHLFDVIVLHKLDRLSRSLIDTLTLLSDLNKLDVSFCSATEQFDFTTPIGKVLLALLAAFSQYFIDNLREETKKGKHERALKGLYNGSLNWGYQRVPKEQGGVPIFDPQNIEGYRMAIRLCAEGQTVREIVHAVNVAGYRTTGNWGRRPFSEDTVLPILKNRFYLGEVYYKGEWLHGQHKAAIDLETWERAQEQLRRRAVKRVTTKLADRIYPLRKKVLCVTCGRLLRGQAIKGERRYRDHAADYDEDCPEPQSVKASIYEEQIGAFLSKVKLPDDWKVKVLARLGESVGAVDQTQQARSRLQSQLERNKRLFVLGDLSEREYLIERKRIQNELVAIPSTKSEMPDLERAALLLESFEDLWQRATDLEKLKLVNAIVEQSWRKGYRIIAIEPRPAMYLLLSTINHDSNDTDESETIRVVEPGTGKSGGIV